MSLLSSNPNERVFYYCEKPIDKSYPDPECFYFSIVEYEKPSLTILNVTILRIAGVDNKPFKGDFLRYSNPVIPKSIIEAVMSIETLINKT